MVREGWAGYRRYAWGRDALSPVSKSTSPALYTMKLYAEFEEGKQWIVDNFDHFLAQIKKDVWVHSMESHFLTPLLSCHALTNETLFLDKARKIADLIVPAYNTTNGCFFC